MAAYKYPSSLRRLNFLSEEAEQEGLTNYRKPYTGTGLGLNTGLYDKYGLSGYRKGKFPEYRGQGGFIPDEVVEEEFEEEYPRTVKNYRGFTRSPRREWEAPGVRELKSVESSRRDWGSLKTMGSPRRDWVSLKPMGSPRRDWEAPGVRELKSVESSRRMY